MKKCHFSPSIDILTIRQIGLNIENSTQKCILTNVRLENTHAHTHNHSNTFLKKIYIKAHCTQKEIQHEKKHRTYLIIPHNRILDLAGVLSLRRLVEAGRSG